MTAAVYNMKIEQGANLDITLRLLDAARVPIDLTGVEAQMQIRASVRDDDALITLTSNPAAGLTIDAPAGTIRIQMTAAQTTALPPSNAVYDLETIRTADEFTIRVIEGQALISPEVTRDVP